MLDSNSQNFFIVAYCLLPNAFVSFPENFQTNTQIKTAKSLKRVDLTAFFSVLDFTAVVHSLWPILS